MPAVGAPKIPSPQMGAGSESHPTLLPSHPTFDGTSHGLMCPVQQHLASAASKDGVGQLVAQGETGTSKHLTT